MARRLPLRSPQRIQAAAKEPWFHSGGRVDARARLGATSAIFSVLHSIVLRPLPFPNPEQLVSVEEVNQRDGCTRSPTIEVHEACGLTRLIASQLYGVTATHPLTIAIVVLWLVAIALLACVVPAQHAARWAAQCATRRVGWLDPSIGPRTRRIGAYLKVQSISPPGPAPGPGLH